MRNDRENNKIGLPCRDRTCWCVCHYCWHRRNYRRLDGKLLRHSGAQHSAASTIIIAAFYSLGGLSILTMRKLGAALGIFFIACEVLGRLYLVMIGIAPSTGGDALKIVIGGLIALAVIGYVASQWKKVH